MHNCKVVATPMNTNEKLQLEDGTEAVDPSSYRSLIGGLNYWTHTHPDIMFSLSVVSRFMPNPTKQHLGAANRVLRYIAGTVNFGIWCSKKSDFNLVGYSDSDWAGCTDDRRSTSGHVFSLGSGAISWSSKKQEVLALSSSEAEYIAAASAACQTVWLRRLLTDLDNAEQEATTVFCDNKATITMTKNPAFHSRTKHIDIRYHFIRSLVAKGEIALKFCGTKEQAADILTKSLLQAKHNYLRLKLEVCNFEARGSVE